MTEMPMLYLAIGDRIGNVYIRKILKACEVKQIIEDKRLYKLWRIINKNNQYTIRKIKHKTHEKKGQYIKKLDRI